MLRWLVLSVLAAEAAGCRLGPPGSEAAGERSPGDNHYRLLVNGEVERYAPGQRYVGKRLLSYIYIEVHEDRQLGTNCQK